MKTNTAIAAATLFIISVAIGGAITANLTQNQEADNNNGLYKEDFNAIADSNNNTATVEFDENGTIGINVDFAEEQPRFFLDLNGDGTFSEQYEQVNRDGTVYRFSKEIVQQDRMYQILYSYKAGEEETWLRIEEIKEI